MMKRVLLGLAVVVGLAAVSAAALLALKGDATGRARAESDKVALIRSLEEEFGGQAEVEFVCRFPVVGVGPCVVEGAMDSREVKLTLTGPHLPASAAPDEQALRIARLAHDSSSFARAADTTEVTFTEGNVSRTYTFAREDMAAGIAPAADSTDEAAEEPRP